MEKLVINDRSIIIQRLNKIDNNKLSVFDKTNLINKINIVYKANKEFF